MEQTHKTNAKNIVNLTPHELVIHTDDGNPPIRVPASGQVARVTEAREHLNPVVMGVEVPVTRASYGAVEGLPEPQKNVIYVVSALVLQRVTGRNDVFAPGPAIRDDQGRIIGCDGLSAPPATQGLTVSPELLLYIENSAATSGGYHGDLGSAVAHYLGYAQSAPTDPEIAALAQAVAAWAESVTPQIVEVPETDPALEIQVEQKRHTYNQTLEVCVSSGAGPEEHLMFRAGGGQNEVRNAVLHAIENAAKWRQDRWRQEEIAREIARMEIAGVEIRLNGTSIDIRRGVTGTSVTVRPDDVKDGGAEARHRVTAAAQQLLEG